MQVSLGRGASRVPPPLNGSSSRLPGPRAACRGSSGASQAVRACHLATSRISNRPFEAAGHPANLDDGSAGLQWPYGGLLEASRQQALPASDQQQYYLFGTGRRAPAGTSKQPLCGSDQGSSAPIQAAKAWHVRLVSQAFVILGAVACVPLLPFRANRLR